MKRVWSIFFTLIIVALLGYVVKDINFYEVYLLVSHANLIWFSLAFLSTAGTFVVWNYRWAYMLRRYVRPKYWFLMKVLLAGSFFNTVTPGAGIGGEPFRAHFISQEYRRPKTKVLGYILGDTFFRMASLAVFIVFSVLFVLFFVQIGHTLKLILEGILVFILVSFGVVIFLILKKLDFDFGSLFKIFYKLKFVRGRFGSEKDFVHYLNRKISSFSGIFRKVVKRKENLVMGFLLSFVFWGLNFLCAYLLFLAFGMKVNFLSVIIVFTLGNIIGSISPVPGGVGVVESSMTLLYSAMGIAPSLALLVSFLQRMTYYFFSLFLGGMSLIDLRRRFNGGLGIF